MPSHAFRRWNTIRARELDEIEAAHASVGGTRRGRRYTTQQLNRAYAVLLAAHFQGFCRDLHTEAADYLLEVIPSLGFRATMLEELMWNRQLDRGNAHQATIGGDFRRLGLPNFWELVDADTVRNARRRRVLETMNEWRNAIAHQDFDVGRLGGRTTLHLRTVRQWRRSCRTLVRSFDNILRDYIRSVTGMNPW